MFNMTRIAIVGMACRYPDATTPKELWENTLAGRRAFRRLPDKRLRLDDYWDADPSTPDRIYSRRAAVLEGYEFDRVAHKIAGSTYRSTDLTHWLALDIAGQVLADAGFPHANGLPRERTGVIVGNTLTGEFSRANLMRLRWPYVRRVVAKALETQGWSEEKLAQFLKDLENGYKRPFPAIDEDTLAGGLSNTIAGRICNYFNFRGGGYTVDGACASSLLAVTTVCEALLRDDIDVAIAGGVDLSLDPFELVGFAKTGALAKTEMRVYDRHSNGFWPGEGCGMVVLMREQDALEGRHRIYATLAGWGVSSDGQGGITRPEVSGYRLALRRAYGRAGFGPDTVMLFEGHGTGTEVGDRTELTALSEARSEADPTAVAAAVGSIKAMIGHTKAAAGVAGLIKAAMAVHERVLPPTVGCVDPHPVLAETNALRVLRTAEPWPDHAPVRAGVTSMGFGGINAHVVIEASRSRSSRARRLTFPVPAEDAELLLLDASSPRELRESVMQLIDYVPQLSTAELGDLSAELQRQRRDRPCRAAVVVSSPEEARRRLLALTESLDNDETSISLMTTAPFSATCLVRDGSDSCSPARVAATAPQAACSLAASRRCATSTPGPRCPPTATWWRQPSPSRASSRARSPACARCRRSAWTLSSPSATASASSARWRGRAPWTTTPCCASPRSAAAPWPSCAVPARWPASPTRLTLCERSSPTSRS